jgi:O-antigen/teichoic acid export membrane protein
MLFAALQLRLVHASDAGQQHGFKQYLKLRTMTTIGALMLVTAVALALHYPPRQSVIVLLVAANKGVEAIIDQCYGLSQQQQRMDIVATSMLGRGIGVLALSTAVLFVTRSVWSSALCMLIVSSTFLFTRDLRMCRALDRGPADRSQRPQYHLPVAKLAREALPLGAVSMLYSVNASTPRLIIQQVMGSHALGIYGSINYLHALGQTVTSALSDSALPRMATYLYDGDRRGFWRIFGKISASIFALCATGVVLVLLFGRELLNFLFGKAYAEHSDLLLWQAATSSVILLTVPMAYGLVAARAYKTQFLIVGLTVATTFALSLAAVRQQGMSGAAWASFVAGVMHFILIAAALVYTIRRFRAHTS